ncbi:MAG: flagellar basal body P-ring formation protein FlgA [Planctomycetes bacterium]|nr:flagellar basal body P-ring formation protein FlgA [Planctomycetota bacterium]
MLNMRQQSENAGPDVSPKRWMGACRRFMGVIALASIAIVCSSAVAGTVRVWPTGHVAGEFVSLGEIAELKGFDADTASKLADVVVYGSPRVGTEMLLRVEDVRAALAESGANLADISLLGSSRCRVTRLAPPKSARATVDPKSADSTRKARKYQPRLPAHKPVGPRGMEATQGAKADSDDRWRKTDEGQTLESILRRHIAAGFSHDEGRVEIRFSPTSRKALSTKVNEDDRIRIRARDERRTGLISFEIELNNPSTPITIGTADCRPVNSQAIQLSNPPAMAPDVEETSRSKEILVSAEVVLVKDVVVARRPINQGQVISGRDLMLEERRFDNLKDIGIEDMAAAVGLQSKRFIRQGEMLDAKSMASRPLVRRGELVKVIIGGGGVEIETTGQAQSGGALGDVIAVRRDGSRRKQDLIDVTIVGPGLVTYAAPRRIASAGDTE